MMEADLAHLGRREVKCHGKWMDHGRTLKFPHNLLEALVVSPFIV
jgi:hypothetical protein